tara:strand:- start:121 stop:252 length:132 start_codon:yes stop_codon:yes gene_type:complete
MIQHGFDKAVETTHVFIIVIAGDQDHITNRVGRLYYATKAAAK